MDKENSILVVDDDVASLLELADILQPTYRVYMVKDGREALELLEHQLHDLILLDIIMPDMNGFDVLSKLKESERTRNIPTIFITGAEHGEIEGLSLGAVDYIRKPFERIVVKHRVDNQIKMQTLNRELEYTAENATKLALVAQAANRTKSSFIAHMSHELSAPLSHLIGITEELLKNKTVPSNIHDDLGDIYSSGNLLMGFINDLLDFSKLEADMIEISASQYELTNMLSAVISSNFALMESKPVSFEINVDENLPALLVGDEFRIKQILSNLLSNAFKYTDLGKVTLSVDTDFRGDELYLVASVEDTGCGMSSEQLDVLYTEYTRFHMSSKFIEGVGLGMPIVKHMLALMHGSIFVKSELGIGTIFTVRIPQKRIGTVVIGTDGVRKLNSYA